MKKQDLPPAAAREDPALRDIRELHDRYLARKGRRSLGLLAPGMSLQHRTADCAACRSALDNVRDVECNACGWIVCSHCGACGCGR